MIGWIEQIEWYLDAYSGEIIFGLIANILCIFDIYCCGSTAVGFVKNDVLLLVLSRKILEIGFLKCF